MKRCTWCNLNNPKYIEYHDYEWGKLNTDEKYLFEMLILESFQAGLSWQCVLNKRSKRVFQMRRFLNPFKKSIKLFIIIYVLLHMERLFMKQEKLHRLFQIPYQMI